MNPFTFVTTTILSMGYLGIASLMALESIILPLPSEAILPFAGYLASTGELNLWLIVIAATIGSLVGSCISYAAGRYGGRPFLYRYGKYFLLPEKTLHQADAWFDKYDERVVFFGRLLPVVRHFISIPAGMSEMHIGSFLTYTTAGAFLWNFALVYAGYLLGEHWNTISKYTAPFESILVIAVILFMAWYVFEAIEKRAKILKRFKEK